MRVLLFVVDVNKQLRIEKENNFLRYESVYGISQLKKDICVHFQI